MHDEVHRGRPSLVNDDLVYKVNSFKLEQMDHPLYSPNLAPSDYHLFLHLQKFLGGKLFDNDDDLKDVVHKWLTS